MTEEAFKKAEIIKQQIEYLKDHRQKAISAINTAFGNFQDKNTAAVIELIRNYYGEKIDALYQTFKEL